jgi:AraC family transcriptional activator FtrA
MPNATTRPGPANRRVVALAYDGLCTFEFGVAVELFGLPRPEMGPDWYAFATAAIEPGPLRGLGGIQVVADGGLELVRAGRHDHRARLARGRQAGSPAADRRACGPPTPTARG